MFDTPNYMTPMALKSSCGLVASLAWWQDHAHNPCCPKHPTSNAMCVEKGLASSSGKAMPQPAVAALLKPFWETTCSSSMLVGKTHASIACSLISLLFWTFNQNTRKYAPIRLWDMSSQGSRNKIRDAFVTTRFAQAWNIMRHSTESLLCWKKESWSQPVQSGCEPKKYLPWLHESHPLSHSRGGTPVYTFLGGSILVWN